MTDRSATTEQATPAPRPRPPMRGGFGGPFGGGGMPVEKPMRFGPSLRRLVTRLSPERWRLLIVIGLGVTSVALLVIGPKILGRATDLIFSGAIGRRLPGGLTTGAVGGAGRGSGRG